MTTHIRKDIFFVGLRYLQTRKFDFSKTKKIKKVAVSSASGLS